MENLKQSSPIVGSTSGKRRLVVLPVVWLAFQIIVPWLLWWYAGRTDGLDAVGALIYIFLYSALVFIVNACLVYKSRRATTGKRWLVLGIVGLVGAPVVAFWPEVYNAARNII